MQSLADYPAAALDLRRRIGWYWVVGIGQVLGTIVVISALSPLSGKVGTYVFLVSSIAYLPTYSFVSVRLIDFKCPRCRARYFRLWSFTRPAPFERGCQKCDLPRS